ncbi:methyltransferase domain-containing protein [Halococcoides cellulosivorans]|uniref:SAM-dependent methyltransferase n=1 Tax=Halococcoides cellulosivorans TaxID=1679096 RepID=A0A2R4WYK6_9EURY|nr:class I SAM-dependent methyltransferase [Halococcoides cellulosivorans]AWB26620.1 SAM-dependent methyltransferase [Halococcoides cellulosivorans]
MNADRRAQVRDAAKYLRAVRPLDPAELATYVEGQPHPAAVRQVLRESAVALGVREREDGTFVPVDDEPIAPPDRPITVPEDRLRAIEDCLVETFGPDWHRGESGVRLRERIHDLKAAYLAGDSVTYDRTTALAYAIYHFPASYASTAHLIDQVLTEQLLDAPLRICEIGAGVGGPLCAVLDRLGPAVPVRYDAVEPSAAAEVCADLVGDGPRNAQIEIHRERAETFDPGEYDLVLAARVANELADPATTLERYADALAADGTFALVAPADRETAIGLRRVERALADRLTVYAPTVRLWPDHHPSSRCWSFDRKPPIDLPAIQRKLAAAADDPETIHNTRVQYAPSILRADDRRRYDVSLDPDRTPPLATTAERVTDRIDAVAIKLSCDLGADDAEANPQFLIGDGSERRDHVAVLVRETTLNDALDRAVYGDCLHFENALVLENRDQDAYNLVIDDAAIVDRIARVPTPPAVDSAVE